MKIGILGTGKIGTDLLVKVNRSKLLECSIFSGIREDSPGILKAKEMGIKTSTRSVEAILEDDCEIVFDCTTAQAHYKHAVLLKDRFVIDMTPSRVGKVCIPSINLEECLKERNVNMATCGSQVMVPVAKKIMEAHPEIKYIEMVSAIASSSAGIGTRNNIDEYTQTTKEVLEELAGVPKAKAIIILNPAEPPIDMRNTLMYELNGKVQYVNRIVKATDGLPGNLDVINVAAIRVAEAFARGENG